MENLNESQYAYIDAFSNAFVKGLFSQGIVKGITPEQLNKYFTSPDFYQSELARIINYYYIANAEIRQIFEIIEASPTLNYQIRSFENLNNETVLPQLKKKLHILNHKDLTRDLLKQLASEGNVVGVWLKSGKKYSPFIFSDTSYIKLVRDFESRLRVIIDMGWFDAMTDAVRSSYFKVFNGIVSAADYKEYVESGGDKRFHEVPFERSIVLRTGTINRNQINGSNWINPVLFDVLHKKKLKDVEQTIANKIINAVAVLTMGQNAKQGEKDRDYDSIPDKLIKSIHQSVKSALSNSAKEGISLVTIPNFSKLEFPDIKSDGLDGDKFEQTDSDIRAGLGISGVMLNGEGSTVASAKLNLDIVYRRIAIMLEGIESEVYNKFFNLNVTKTQRDNFYMEYQKEVPLTLKEKLDYQTKLNDKGWSSRHVIEAMGLDFDEYLAQTVYENDTLKLNTELLIPPKTSHTSSNDESINGRPEVDSPENENTERSKETEGNNNR